MKTTAYLSILLLFIVISSVSLSAQTYTLDDILNRVATEIGLTLPTGTNIAILSFNSPTEAFSDYVIEELTGKLVKNPSLTVVDRKNLALINKEVILQLSGEVNDTSAVAIGQLLGAQSIVTGNLTNTGDVLRFRISVVNVETAAIQTQIALDLKSDSQVAFLLGASIAGTQTTTLTTTTTTTTTASNPNEPPIQGINASGNTFSEKLTWLQRNADSNNTYILIATANDSIAPQTFRFEGAKNVTVVLRGDAVNRVIKLSSNGTMFTLIGDVTLVLDNNITLQGLDKNTGSIVSVQHNATLKMRTGSTVTGNTNSNSYQWEQGAGITVYGGTFEMTGGTISNNKSANEYCLGGGVCLFDGTFTMSGGIITGNVSHKGAGVYMRGVFNMNDGIITGNTARQYGGGVFIETYSGEFTKRGGTITGYNTDQINGNAVRDEDGILARRGHTIYRRENQRRETTAGPNFRISTKDNDPIWE